MKRSTGRKHGTISKGLIRSPLAGTVSLNRKQSIRMLNELGADDRFAAAFTEAMRKGQIRSMKRLLKQKGIRMRRY